MIEGPHYADRVGGRLSYRDWDTWEPEDRKRYPRPINMESYLEALERYRLALWNLKKCLAVGLLVGRDR